MKNVMRDIYINLSSCKRFDCKYHAPLSSMNGCDYCFLTNLARKSDIKICNKYSPCTPDEKQKYREEQISLQSQIAERTYIALTHDRNYYMGI